MILWCVMYLLIFCTEAKEKNAIIICECWFFSSMQISNDGNVQGSFQIGYAGITFNVSYFYPSPSGGAPSCNISPKSGGGVSMSASPPSVVGSTMTCTITSS